MKNHTGGLLIAMEFTGSNNTQTKPTHRANSAAATTRPLFTLNANAANAPLEFEEMAVFGKEDELSSPAKGMQQYFSFPKKFSPHSNYTVLR